jgi:pimeloyl-ACP methyl ester carboxylesterase
VIVGHSWGGHVALAAAIRRPDLVRSVGIYETALTWTPWWPHGHEAMIRQAAQRATTKTTGSPRQITERTLFISEALETLAEPYRLDELSVPCVTAYGACSMRQFREGIESLAALIGAQVVVFPKSGHMGHRDEPEMFAAFVRTTVAAALPRGSQSL